MNTVSGGPSGRETGLDLQQLGERAATIVATARASRVGGPGVEQADARRLSVREIADRVGRTVSTAHDHLKKIGASATGRFGYSLQDMISVRESIGNGPEPGPTISIALSNFKGGVSKSSTAATLGHYLAGRGYRTLMVDCDPQGTLSTLLGMQPDFELSGEDTLLPFLAGETEDLVYAIRDTELSTLKAIPAMLELEYAVAEVLSQQTRKGASEDWFYAERLAQGLATIEGQFDVVLMDCPPNMGPLTTMATTAADALLVPLRPSMPDFASSAQFLTMFGQTMQDNDAASELIHKRASTKDYAWVRVLLTQSQGRKAEKEISDYIRMAYGTRVLAPEFPHMTAVSAAGNRMRTIYDVAKEDVGRDALRAAVQQFDALGEEIEHLITQAREAKAAAASTGDRHVQA